MEDDEIPYYQKVRVVGDSLLNKLKRISTSSLLFILSFIASNLLLQLFTAWISVTLKYTIRFSYNQVRVFPWDYHYWSRTTVVLIFLFSPLICMVLGLFIFNLLRVYTNWSNVSRIFFFWLALNLVNLVLTHALLSPLGSPMDRNNGLYQTFAVVGIFLWINPALMTIVSIGSLVLTLLLGVIIRKEVMRYSFSKTLIEKKRGMDIVVIQVFVLPVLAGSLPLILLCSPVGFFTTVMQIANLGIVSVGIFMMNSIGTANVRCIKSDVLNHFPIIELAICASAWLTVFVFLK
jgi:hypothetical protein